MTFHRVAFPNHDCFWQGTRSGPRFRNRRVATGSDSETVTKLGDPIGRFSINTRGLTAEAHADIRSFALARNGSEHSFMLRDPADFVSNPKGRPNSASEFASLGNDFNDRQMIGAGDGVATEFQLVKNYIDAESTYTRRILLPEEGSVRVWADTVANAGGEFELALGTDFTVDYRTGRLLFTSAAQAGTNVFASYRFFNHVRFDESADDWLSATFQSPFHAEVENLQMSEVIDQRLALNGFDPGGTNVMLGESTDVAGLKVLNPEDGRHQFWTPTSGANDIRLWDTINEIAGTPFFFRNLSGTQSANLNDFAGGSVTTVPANGSIHLVWTGTQWLGTR